ncbi:MAG: ABC transporter permease [Saprospiraceae bacterium]|nr:ABC transporter permease [Saprospiraceae bacterium]
MWRNYLKLGWRHIQRNRNITAINFIGLVVGMTAVILIWQYVDFERSYDKFHAQGDQIFRVQTDRIKDGIPFMQFAGGAACAGPVIARNVPEVEDYVKLRGPNESLLHYHFDQKHVVDDVYFAMGTFFDFFSFELLEGDAGTCLKEPWTACITKTLADKVFGPENPMGKTIVLENEAEYVVTGIVADPPENSHLGFSVLLSYATFSDVFVSDNESETAWYWDGYLTYLKLKPNTNWQELEPKFKEAMAATYDEEVAESTVFSLQPLPDIHLTSNLLGETKPPGDGTAVKFLFLVGILILIIAWFNYINLTTAQSMNRAREVGIRKVIGSNRSALIRQFMTEAVIINAIAIICALIFATLLGPAFVNMVDTPMPTSIFDNPRLLMILLACFGLGTFLTGMYPALLQSSYKPIQALNPNLNRGRIKAQWVRKGLVVFQFGISVALIASTLVIYNQMRYMQKRDLGISTEKTLVIEGPLFRDSTYLELGETFKTELAMLPAVKSISGSSSVPGERIGWTAGIQKWGQTEEDENYGFRAIAADPEYSDQYDMEIIAGRSMSRDHGADASSCLLNEEGVKVFQFESPESALGEEINFWGQRVQVVGVVRDFHQASPKAKIEPIILRNVAQNWMLNYFSVKLVSDDMLSMVENMKGTYDRVFGANSPMEYFFLDEHYDQQYKSEALFGKVFTFFSGLAILISCLGLLALIAFVVERRRKEIGIRKVLGSSISGIVMILSKDFLFLVIIAAVLAIPVVHHFMKGWLDGFAYRIDMEWWVFLVAVLLAVAIAFFTVGYQSLVAARQNPVDSLQQA